MKIERAEPEFKPVMITLETPKDLADFKLMVNYAYQQSGIETDVDRITREYRDLLGTE